MENYFSYFLDGADKGLTLLSAFIVLLLMSSIGGVIGGRNRVGEIDVFTGWGAVTVIFTVAAVFLSGPLGVLSWVFFAAGLACSGLLLRREGRIVPPGTLRVLLLLSPLLLLASAMEPSQWDEFSHWLSAPKSLFLSNDVPSLDNPPQGTQMLAAYPYGWPYMTFLASRAVGAFMDGAGRIFNVVFLAMFGLLALKVAMAAAGRKPSSAIDWRLAGLAALFIALINPTFIQKIILTAYADTSTAVTLGVAAYLLWVLLDAEAEGDAPKSITTAWQVTFVAAALINIKQVNLILFLGLVLSFLIAAWRDPDIRLGRTIRLTLGFSVLPLSLYIVWRYHVGANMPAGDFIEAGFMAFENWHTGLIGQILLQMLVVAGKKGAFFAIMAVAVALAAGAFFRPSGRYGRLAILGGGTFIAYNFFLLFVYVSSFGETAALTAVSYWRYNTHLGMIAVLLIAAAAGLAWKHWKLDVRLPEKVKWLPVLLIVATPFLFAHKLRFDLEPDKPHFTAIAKEIASLVPKDIPLVIIDPSGTGESAVITRYFTAREMIPYLSAFQNPKLVDILAMTRQSGDETRTIVHSLSPEMKEYFGDRFAEGVSYLMEWRERDWRIVKQWPYP